MSGDRTVSYEETTSAPTREFTVVRLALSTVGR